MGKHGKQEEMWDDSALINAFNDAISKYMKIHVQGSQNCSPDEGKVISSKEEKSSTLVDQTNDERGAGINDESTISSITAEIKESGNCSTMKETSYLESEAPENHVGSSTGQYIHDEHSGYSFSQSTEEYNQLVNKYYELEDQRQKILQQLNQFGYWNHDFAATTLTSQEPQASSSQAHATATCSFCPYGCQSWVTPCTSLPCYCSGGTCVSKSSNAPAEVASTRNITSTKGTDFVKTAMVAAERALTSLKEKAYTNACDSANEGKEKQLETDFCLVEKSTSSETDLTVVLNAWYSAGFYTGKYLSEQSFANSRQG